MAKQDLVVKLMLDSGAFGNDLRTAERKAQEFSNKMQNAGTTAGKFTNEIGLSAGAFSKLGGILTGAGGVIAAVGAFKSVMMSSHDSAKKFQGVISGFGGVLESLQYSFSTFDFTAFNKGWKEVYLNAKQAKEAMLDAQLSTIAYGIVDRDTRLKLKEYEVEYRNPNTTKERRAEIAALRDGLLKEARITAEAHAENLYTSVIEQLQAKNPNIGDLTGDLAKTKELIPSDRLNDLILEAAYDIIFNRDEEEKKRWEGISQQMTQTKIKADTNAETADMSIYYATPKWISDIKEWLGFGSSHDAWMKSAASYGATAAEAQKQWEETVMKYQDLMIKNVLYTIGEEGLSKIAGDMKAADDVVAAIDELLLQGMGWSEPTTKTTGGSTTKTPKKDPDVRNVMSIGYLEEMIAAQKEMMDGFDVGTSDWWDAVDAIDAYQTELNELKAYQNALLGIVDDNNDAVEGSIAYYEELIKKTKNLRDNKKFESEEWHKLTEELKEYTKALEDLKAKQAIYDGTPTSDGDDGDDKNEELKKKRKAAVDAWNEREKYDKESEAWDEANEKLKEYVAEYQRFIQTLDDNDPIDRFQKKLADANMVVSSSVSVLNALSDTLANSEDESAKKAGAWIDVFSTIGAGVQSYISIMQGAIATDEAYAMAKATGQAATLPFPANIAAIATTVATLASVIAKINSIKNSAGKFAEGGIVGGTSYSGDKLFAMVNSGEMILNKRQQGNLANMFGGGGQVEFHISGDSLVGVLNNRQNKRNLTR